MKTAETGFERFFHDPNSLTARGARLSQVTPEQFGQWRWQMKHQVRSATEAQRYIKLSSGEERGFQELGHLFHAGITPYAMANMHTSDPSCPVRRQLIPDIAEGDDPEGEADPLQEVFHSPVPEVVHVYPDRVAFCVAELCPVYCRYCFRKRREEEHGLHFNRKIIDRGIEYIAQQPAIRDVLITGGDPWIAQDESIEYLLKRLRAVPHVDIIRFGTRTPVTLPYRITPAFASMLERYHPIWVNTHFNHEKELTPEAQQALQHLLKAGIPVGNQSVLLRGINDERQNMLALLRRLLSSRVRPYYVFHPHRIAGTKHLRVDLRDGLKMMESLRGHITGFGLPTYALDTPSGKIPLTENRILSIDGDDLIIKDLRGDIIREKAVFRQH